MSLVLRLAATAILALGFALVVACVANPPASISPTIALTAGQSTVAAGAPTPPHRPRQHSTDHIEGLGEPIDAAHFIDSFPNHAQTLIQSPARVGINFDLSLTDASNITLERDGEPIAVGAPIFDSRKIYMSVAVPPASDDGLYLAKYHACLADGSCEDGQIGFRVDATGVKNFVDLRGQGEVMIHLTDVTYQPNQIIVSPGTMVTWVNDDPFDHFVNSDPHPSHNAFSDFNSLDIPPSRTFSFTFDKVGEYAFHCSAHVPQNMFGTILVRESE